MGTNKTIDVVDTPFGSKLRIKTKDRTLAPEKRTKLVNSLELAANTLRGASTELIVMWRSTELQRSVLETHFKLGERARDQQRHTLAEEFMRMRRELMGNLTIADASSSVFKQELRNMAESNVQKLLELEENARQKQAAVDVETLGSDQMAAEAEHDKVQAWHSGRAQRTLDAVKHATQRSAREMGFAKPHKPFAALRPKAAEWDNPRMEPNQFGSIHINFQTLLDADERPSMKLAITIIHEASHKFIDALDFAYVYEEKYGHMSLEEAMRNADSYAFAAASLYRGTLIRKDADIY